MHESETQLPRAALVQMILGAAAISTTSIFVKLAHVGPTMSGFYRMGMGGVMLLVGLIALGQWRRVRLAEIGWLLVPGVAFAIDLMLWHRSILYVGPGVATLLGNFQVFVLAGFGALVLGERGGWRLWTGLLCVSSLLSAIVLGVAALGEGESFLIPDTQSWGALLGLAFCGQVLGWVLLTRAMPQLPASTIGLLLLLQPALSFVLDVILFARPTQASDWIGVALSLAGIFVGCYRRGRRAQPPAGENALQTE